MTDASSNEPMKILFVCTANLCRSPLAEIIAKKFYRELIHAESAGVSPAYCPVYEETRCVAEKYYGADFSGHMPRHILEFPLAEFDYIIAMDLSIGKALAEMKPVPQDKVVQWEIADPCGYGMEVYEETARKIELELKRFVAARLSERKAPLRSE